MDEIFGEVGFAQADLERKQKIERDIGLIALLNGEESVADKHLPDGKMSDEKMSDSEKDNELVEKAG
jgi:hypothetical protein